MSQRTILFRGKRVDNGEWVEGDLWQGFNEKVFIAVGNDRYEVLPETVGQWTGLYDKNKARIWEGDVITFNALDADHTVGRTENHIFTGAVEYSQGRFVAMVPEWGEARFYGGEWTEIIGNIHDTPSLLNGKN